MSSQFTDKAREALNHASKFASRLKQGYVGTEHILAGLLKEDSGVAYKVLTDNHVELSQVLDMIQELIAFENGVGLKEREGYSPRARKVLEESHRQAERFGPEAKAAGKSMGLRINPERSTQEGHAIYDPCAPGSRLGVTLEAFEAGLHRGSLQLLDGLHFHTLCEQDADALEATLEAVEEKFGRYLPGMRWINFGGGHHITRPGYDIPRLERCIGRMQDRYGLTVYLEPGEAVALNAGFLIAEVLETLHNGMDIAILDTSAACHMPHVLEMPYRPPLRGSGEPGEKACTYRLGGPTCLAGDIIGDYSFDRPLKEGDRLVFQDMAIYSMVKNNTFNGMPLPAIALRRKNGECDIVKEFGYRDFKERLS